MQQSDEINYLLGVLRRRYPLFIAAFIVVFGVSVVVALALPPIFRSEAKILVESQQIPSELVRSTVTGLADERIAVTRQRITAREALLLIIDKYSLFPEERSKLSVTELVDRMRARIFILPFDLALTGRRARDGALTVAFTVGFEYERPDTTAKVANELVTLILNEDVRSRTSKASETTQFLDREAQRLQQELTKTEKILSEFKQQNRDALPERIPFQMSALERAETNLKSLDREMGALAESKRLLALEMSVRKAAQMGDLNSGGQDDPFRRLELLRADLIQKAAIYSESHPEIKALRGQINALERQITAVPGDKSGGSALSPEELSRLDLNSRIVAEKLDTIERQLKLYGEQRSTITAAVAALTAVLSQAPEVQINLALIERQSSGLQKQLEEISGKLTAARLGEQLERDQQAERFQVIEQPITPQDPVRPNRPMIVAIGFFLAALAGTVLAGGLEFLNQSVRSSKDILKGLDQHPLVVIPYIRTLEEGRRGMSRLWLGISLAVAVALIGMAALHYFYLPIDLLVTKILTRLGLRSLLDFL